MQTVEITQGGVIDPEDLLWVGGSYSWLARIRRGGIGSPKVIYVNGIPAFDTLSHEVVGQTTFANFELLTEGLLVRGNCTQRIAAVAMRYENIAAIQLVGYPVKIKTQQQTIYKGALAITSNSDEQYLFATRVSEFEAVKGFFGKAPEFKSVFMVKLSDTSLDEDSELARCLALLGD